MTVSGILALLVPGFVIFNDAFGGTDPERFYYYQKTAYGI